MIIEESHRDFYKIGNKRMSTLELLGHTDFCYKTLLSTEDDLGLLDHTDFSSNKDLLQQLLSLRNTACKNNNFLTQMKEVEGFVTGLFVFGKIKQLRISQ